MKSLQNNLYCKKRYKNKVTSVSCFFFFTEKAIWFSAAYWFWYTNHSPQIILNHFCRMHDWGLRINSDVLINSCEITKTVLCYEFSDWSVALQAFKDLHPQANTITAHQCEQLAMKLSQHCIYLHVLCCSLDAHHCMG